MIEIKNLTKKFEGRTALENISFKVERGSVYGLVGFNGAGKTTLIKCIAGVYKPESGEVLIDGQNTFSCAEARSRLFYVPDEIVFQHRTIKKSAEFYSGFFARFSFEMLEKLCKIFELDMNERLTSFSKGMLRQAEMIIAVSSLPEVLLLDEAFDGLDPAKRSLMNNLILDYAAERESSVVVSSHNLHEIADICDHVALIDGKKIVKECSVDDAGADHCRFRLVFNENKSESDFEGFNIKKIKCDGRMITLTLIGSEEENEAKLKALNPLMIEKYPQSLEEVFLEEMEETDYDFRELFS